MERRSIQTGARSLPCLDAHSGVTALFPTASDLGVRANGIAIVLTCSVVLHAHVILVRQ